MTQQDAANQFSDHNGRAAAIRAAADGELPPEREQTLLEDAVAAGQVAYERALRGATARVMGAVSAPPGLRDRVLALAGEARQAEADALAEGLEGRAEQTRDPAFWNAGRRLVAALAAVLVLTVAGVFIARVGGLAAADHAGYRTDLARFVTDEHARTLDESYASRKYVYTAVDAAVENVADVLHRQPRVPPCGDSTRFAGAAPCGVPGEGPSAHFRFNIAGEDSEVCNRPISMFVKQDNNELEIEPGQAYEIVNAKCDLENHMVSVWRQNGLIYTLVSARSDAPLCSSFFESMGVRPPTEKTRL